MIDGGVRLEPERAQAVAELRAKRPTDWSKPEVSRAKGNVVASTKGVQDKLLFGSDYPFRGGRRFRPFHQENAKMYQSLADGGLSNVWGASVLPYTDDDTRDWPFPASALAPHYRAVLGHLPLAARADDLEALFPLYDDRRSPLPLSRQAASFLADLDAGRGELAGAGFTYGQSRLAVAPRAATPDAGCVACRLCMYGCPWDHIWSSRLAVEALRDNPNFRRETGLHVETLLERNGGVEVRARALETGESQVLQADRVVLAAGPLSSTRILLSSLELFDRPVKLQHSDHFQFPFVRLKGTSGVTDEDLHTLAQLYLELRDPGVDAHTVHLQVYTYNDFFGQVIEGMLGRASPLFALPTGMILGRLLLVQAYLHSAVSSHVEVTLAPGDEGALSIRGVGNPEAARVVERVVAKLNEHTKTFRARVAPGMAALSKPGDGNHSGGSFPMRARPGPLESDVQGRPAGLARVHVADSTVLPSLPATTITLSVMANAHRIGALVAAELTGTSPSN
jgi:choline dehydrogenase-like flavoprotein